MAIKYHSKATAQDADGKSLAGQTLYAGLVVGTGSNYHGDGVSSYYALVWDFEKNDIKSVYYGSDMGFDADAAVDAPVEIIALYENQLWDACRARQKYQAELQAKVPEKGKVLQVVRGRKVPIGTKGVCVWMGNSGYGMRVMLIDANGNKHTTSIGNVEVRVGETMTLPERKKETVTVLGTVAKQSDKAVLLKTSKGEVWFPKSQIKSVAGGYEMPDWLAKKAGVGV